MAKSNCWEFMKCGREPGGFKAGELGVCPASAEERTDGLNFGKNGGRVCWAIVGTLCGGKVQGTFAVKLNTCVKCEFRRLVIKDEGYNNLAPIEDILLKLKK